MKSYIALFSLITLSFVVFGQNASIDSLKSALQYVESDTSKVSTLISLGYAYVEENIEEASSSAKQALDLSNSINFQIGEAKSHQLFAQIFEVDDQLDSSITSFNKSISSFQNLKMTSDAMDVMHQLGILYSNNYKFQKAIGIFEKELSNRLSLQDTSKILASMARIARCYMQNGEYKTSIVKALACYHMAIENNDLGQAAVCSSYLGVAYRNLGQPQLALKHYNEAIDLSKKIGNKRFEAAFLENTGIVYSNIGAYTSALSSYLKAVEIYKELGREDDISVIQLNIGLIYKKNGEHKKAIDYYKTSLAYDISNNDSLGISRCTQNIGTALLAMDSLNDAKSYLIQSYQLIKKLNRKCIEGEAASLGDLYHRLGKLDSAKYYLELELISIKTCGLELNLASTTFILAKVYNDLNQPAKALSYLKISFEAARKSTYQEDIKNSSLALYEWYKKDNNPQKSLFYLEFFQQTSDSLFNQENTRKLAWLEANHQMNQVTDSLERQKREEAEVLNHQISDQKKQIATISLIAAGVIILIILYYFLTKKQRQLKYQKALSKEKSSSFKAVIHAQEEERKRIAKDLHDGIVQQLGGLKLGLQKAFTHDQNDANKKLIEILDNSAQELRELSHRMMPKSLSELGLIPATEDMLQNSLGNTDINYEFEHFGIQERLKDNIEIAIYRITQELINNVTKHSQADKVNIQLFKTGDHVMLIVEDNGQGFDTSSNRKGIGLMNISSRLDTVNGKVNYEPSPESGTLVTIKIPLNV